MYQLDTFHLHKNEGASEWVGGWCIQKTIKKCHQVNQISTSTSLNNSLLNAINFGIFLPSSSAIWLYCWRRGLDPPYGGCFLLSRIHHYVHYAMIKSEKVLFVSSHNSGRRKYLITSSSHAQGANTVTVKTVKLISLSWIDVIITSSLRNFSGVLHDLLPKYLDKTFYTTKPFLHSKI